MNWIGLIFTFAGALVFGIFGIQIVLLLMFSIPLSNKLDRLGLVLNKKALIKTDLISIVVNAIILAIIIVLVAFIFPNYPLYFAMGMGIDTLILVFKKKKTDQNTQDYIKGHYQYIEISDRLTQFLIQNGYLTQ